MVYIKNIQRFRDSTNIGLVSLDLPFLIGRSSVQLNVNPLAPTARGVLINL